ncbi:hypothetical protein [Niastella populi]|uniref:Uncharacterized protein n=1 Tax=Niastella populi TaxID=550983 RepID=A0A1V9ESA3_9BACT|nr:hypothetical protein [Niastella populi]OQP48922.1 hypothetical protein A4R26_31260 [Niastella populi]
MRTLLIILVAFVGITSTLIGMLLIAYPVVSAYGLWMDFLHPAFDKNFTLPGVMFIITGGVNLNALLSCSQRSRTQYSWSLIGSICMMAWVVTHSILLQAMPWLYLTYLSCCLLILLLSLQLKGKWAV